MNTALNLPPMKMLSKKRHSLATNILKAVDLSAKIKVLRSSMSVQTHEVHSFSNQFLSVIIVILPGTSL